MRERCRDEADPAETEAEKERVEQLKTMATEKVAPMVAFLLADASKNVTGQLFSVRKNEIMLFSQPRPIRSMQKSEGWTPEAIAEELLPAFESSFYPLDRTRDIIGYPPICSGPVPATSSELTEGAPRLAGS